MQFDNQKTRNVADIVAKILAGESAKQEPQMLGEELVGNQHKIDANKNKKIDAHDFKMLRSQKDKEKANSMKFGKNVKEQVKPEVEKSFPATGVTKHAPIKGVNYMPKDKEKANSQKFGKDVKEETEEIDEATPTAQQVKQGIGIARDKRYAKGNVTGAVSAMDKVNKGIAQHPVVNKELRKQNEETELAESHFKVGDKVKCKTSGMKGEVVKLDKEDGDEDDKYYTVKREDGKMKKMAPEDMTKINEASEKEEEKFHSKLDTLVHKTFGKRKEEMKEENIDEAMFPGTKEYEKKFGQSPQQKLKKVGDTEKTAQGEMKKTAKGVMHTRRFSEMVSAYQEQGLKFVASLVKEEPDNEEYEKEITKAKDKSVGKDKAEVAKASVQAVKSEETHTKIQMIDMTDPDNIQKSEIDLEEREMTDAEMKERERIVKGMKKGMQGFKQRYGDRAKEVMYATATKQSMKD
jgi:hypothetical protein